ncbi:phage tail protein [Enterococcus sp. BWM-S5]|uniref:Phage tail protein n=1 Tax=Enterococcus larvae TaxID=2794352 RepID=A0ABS4CIG3_9ENTE|nr:phage tail spike protein [Enterococcus larvae]MBP1046397.1 phage tail protein [Enterococcus larvae]
MENVRIMVRDALDLQTLTILDNSAVNALHYTSDTINRFAEGGSSVFSCEVAKTNDDVQFLTVGNKLAFIWKGKDYWLNIIDTQENEYSISIMAFSLSLELNNETRSAYKSDGSMTFTQYLSKFDPEKTLVLGLNEISDKRISYEWDGTQSMLARLYSLANVFSAEIEFVTVLNDDYSLKQHTIDVYREHSDTSQGMGEDKTNITLRIGKEIKSITRKESIKELYTAITPVGKDGLNLSGYNRTEHDENGRVEFFTDNTIIRAPLARDRFPSFSSSSTDRYISTRWETEYTTKEALYGAALAELKKNCVPQLEFEVDTYFDTNPGDTLTVESDKFKPTLIMEARVIEQVESFTDPSKNKTTFSNFKEIGSQIDSSLLAKVQQLIDANKKYDYQIVSDNGIVFKNGEGQTTLTARVMDGVEDITDSFFIMWFKDGQHLTDIKSLPVSASDVMERALYRFEATNTQGAVIGGAEATVSNVDDGQRGDDGIGIAESVIEYAVSESGTEEPSEGWQTDIPVVPVGQFLWTRTTQTFTDEAQTTAYSVSKIGSDGKEGEKGDAGIVYQEDEPTEKVLGMLWQQPGEPLKRWNGSTWVIHQFFVDNFFAENLTVSDGKFEKLEGAEITSPFDRPITTGAPIYRKGTASIFEGRFTVEYTQYNTSDPATTTGAGNINVSENGVMLRQLAADGSTLTDAMQLFSGGILFNSPASGKTGQVTVDDLILYSTTLTIAYGINANLTRIGKMVTLSITRTSKNWTGVDENILLSAVIPTGYRPRVPETVTINRNNQSNISTPVIVHINADGTMRYTNSSAGQFIFSASASWFTNDIYPV